ncbi:hypothetical protein Y1Q_0002387 [Alligator mississippiensis]|uniref:Uncharacterized protein n=1 Tax=Alligator mississippiensis TaxID=8496 RepID=A0A151MGZ0_ALLMI|nr:hypothetical protein Y1Q_0002387 [Alligator mississippiensis]
MRQTNFLSLQLGSIFKITSTITTKGGRAGRGGAWGTRLLLKRRRRSLALSETQVHAISCCKRTSQSRDTCILRASSSPRASAGLSCGTRNSLDFRHTSKIK